MSISAFFNKKARAMAAAATLALGTAGGYIGMEAAGNINQPQPGNFALENLPPDTTERQFIAGRIPGVGETPAQEAAREDFVRRIDTLAYLRHANDPALPAQAADFFNALRTSEKISEQDYALLLKDYEKRVGLDVSARAGNYRAGVAFNQECQVGAAFASLFDDEDLSPGELAADVGACMEENQSAREAKALSGGAGGAAIGGLLGLPLWLRRRKAPKIFRSRKP